MSIVTNENQYSKRNKGCDKNTSRIIEEISQESFKKWYKAKQYTENIRNGQHYFNPPPTQKELDTYNPSELLKCHRKTYYSYNNAPEETTDPHGIYWFGTNYEEQIIEPYLQDITQENQYVQNSIWINPTITTEVGEIEFKGSTDPVIVDETATPILPTEIKSKKTLNPPVTASEHHRAQIHTYLYGLSKKQENTNITTALLIYGDRKNFDLQPLEIDFDPRFWRKRVIDWIEKQTRYRAQQELPPQKPEQSWECNFCQYKQRCGKGDSRFNDIGPEGLLPQQKYPRQKVINHLETHPKTKLTPTTAEQYPDLTEKYSVYRWKCPVCSKIYSWNDTQLTEQDDVNPPFCTRCKNKDKDLVTLYVNSNIDT